MNHSMFTSLLSFICLFIFHVEDYYKPKGKVFPAAWRLVTTRVFTRDVVGVI